jgi:hypothetical protein
MNPSLTSQNNGSEKQPTLFNNNNSPKILCGGIMPQKPNEDFISKARYAVSEKLPDFIFLKLLSVSTQVVAGLNYYFDVLVQNNEGENVIYRLTLWEQSWLNKTVVTNVEKLDDSNS